MIVIWIHTFALIALGLAVGMLIARLRLMDDEILIGDRRLERLEKKLGLKVLWQRGAVPPVDGRADAPVVEEEWLPPVMHHTDIRS